MQVTDFTCEQFKQFFQELWGFEPFPWQSALAGEILAPKGDTENPDMIKQGLWPEAITVPTAAGKTACIDIAVFALAASCGASQMAPRRIWFVVDRRVIVDEAYERARLLAGKLRDASGGIVFEVAERLRKLAGGGPPLLACLLRGGVYRDDSWARSPVQPTVIASTVDQFGSRLLFRAYGRSFKAWPIQAGLAGNDSLVFLDEAHCAQPFFETLRAVARYRTLAAEPLSSSFQAVVLSATPPEGIAHRHAISTADKEHPILGARLAVDKPLRLADPVAGKGKDAEDKFAAILAAEAKQLIDASAGRQAIVVFVNRVATARRVFELLDTKNRPYDVVLLTGRMRPIDKDDTVSKWLTLLSATSSGGRQLVRPVIVVATQTLEVGANLDFDGLVSECASLDALRQRLGRLNRTGRPIEAHSVLVIRADQAINSDDDPVYGPSLSHTWDWLQQVADNEHTVNFGVNALASLLPQGAALSLLNAPARHAPVLLPAHLDAWVQTAPMPLPSPDPALFLHGPTEGAADVQVCWRLDLDPGYSASWSDSVSLCPPTASESLAAPFGRFRAWLSGTMTAQDDSGDIEGIVSSESSEQNKLARPRQALRWLGKEDAEVIVGADRLRPGDLVVLPGADGLAELGHLPPTASLDHGERANLESRGKVILRLHPAIIAQWPDCLARKALADLVANTAGREENPEEWVRELRVALTELAVQVQADAYWLSVVAGSLSKESGLGRLVIEHPSGGLVLRGARRLRPDMLDDFTDEDDSSASGTVRVELLDHNHRVGERAGLHGELVGLPQELCDGLRQAGNGHDTGKCDPRFQSWLHGGRPAMGPLLAKSARVSKSPRMVRLAREKAGYPEGGRHELLSVRLLEGKELDARFADLILHLVASHHGLCRPFAPVVTDLHPAQVVHPLNLDLCASSATGLERLDSGVPERYWRLVRRHGWWGLAWLEALLRLADHIESAEEQK
jgi:CRISPR-associated endonuclease/helicase Cas3